MVNIKLKGETKRAKKYQKEGEFILSGSWGTATYIFTYTENVEKKLNLIIIVKHTIFNNNKKSYFKAITV